MVDTPAQALDPEPAAATASRWRLGVWAATAVLLSGGFGLLWWSLHALSGAQHSKLTVLEQRVLELNVRLDGQERELSQLRTRIQDVGEVNRVLREQVLGMAQRLNTFEDSLRGLARSSAATADEVGVAEARWLLQVAQIRAEVFHDRDGALRALELADRQLAGLSDPRLASVRQSIRIEADALARAPAAELDAVLTSLDRIGTAARDWPRARPPAAEGARLWILLDRYLRVRERNGPGDSGPLPIDPPTALMHLLDQARAAAIRRETERYRALLERARAWLGQHFDSSTPEVRAAHERLGELAALELEPQLPKIGNAWAELERLRQGDAWRHRPAEDAPGDSAESPAAAMPPADAAP